MWSVDNLRFGEQCVETEEGEETDDALVGIDRELGECFREPESLMTRPVLSGSVGFGHRKRPGAIGLVASAKRKADRGTGIQVVTRVILLTVGAKERNSESEGAC